LRKVLELAEALPEEAERRAVRKLATWEGGESGEELFKDRLPWGEEELE
jgi:hypothetical protein